LKADTAIGELDVGPWTERLTVFAPLPRTEDQRHSTTPLVHLAAAVVVGVVCFAEFVEVVVGDVFEVVEGVAGLVDFLEVVENSAVVVVLCLLTFPPLVTVTVFG
jgi:hypothetical protein